MIKNTSHIYSIANEMKCDVDDADEKHQLYKQFVAWCCNGCSISSINRLSNNPIFQELPTEKNRFSNADERIYVDTKGNNDYTDELEKLRHDDSDLVLKINLKNGLAKKLRLRVWVYSQREYLYLLSNRRLTINYKTYSIAKKRYLKINPEH